MITTFYGSMLLLVPAILLALYAQYKVKSTYNKYAEVGTRAGLTGGRGAPIILEPPHRPPGDAGAGRRPADRSCC